MDAETIIDVAKPTTLTSWCGGCDTEMLFEPVDGGIGVEYACRGCGAAVFSGDLALIETILQPALA